MSLIPQAAIADLLDRNDIVAVAAQYVRLRGSGRTKIGPCPACSPDRQSKTATRCVVAPGKAPKRWLCAACNHGGNAINFVMAAEGIDFRAAVERLGGVREIDAAEAALREAAAAARRAEEERVAAEYREQERAKLYGIWRQAEGKTGIPQIIREYFRLRDIDVPAGLRVRLDPRAPYYVEPKEKGARARLIHTGPAMLLPILVDGRFSGLHFTWLDLAQPKGKIKLAHPDTGEPLRAEKVRGSKKGGYIEWKHADVSPDAPTVMVAGEGPATVGAVCMSAARVDHPMHRATAYRVAIDLGNLAGRAIETVAHPELKTPAGRPARVPGDVPDMDSPAMPVPDSVELLIGLGDGDSDPFTTRMAMTRFARRHTRPGRTIKTPFAPPGEDFDSWRRM